MLDISRLPFCQPSDGTRSYKFSIGMLLENIHNIQIEILGVHFCANMKLNRQSAIIANYLKIIDFFLIRMISMYQNYECFKFHDVTLTLILHFFS